APFGPRTAVNDPEGIEKLPSDQMAFDPYPAARPRATIAPPWSFIDLRPSRKGGFERSQLRGLPVLERRAERLKRLGDPDQGDLLLLRQQLQAHREGTGRLDIEDEHPDLLPSHLVVERRHRRCRRVGAFGNRVHELWG